MYLLEIIATFFSIFKTIACNKSYIFVFQILEICLKVSKKLLSSKLLRKKKKGTPISLFVDHVSFTEFRKIFL